MLNQILIFLPVVMCVFVIMISLMMANKSRAFSAAVLVFLVSAIYFYTDSCYTSVSTNLNTLALTNLIAQFVTPCMLPLAIHYLRKLNDRRRVQNSSNLWIILPVGLVCADLALIASMGWTESMDFIKGYYAGDITIEEMAKSQYILFFCMQNVFRLILLLEIIAFFVWCFGTAHREGFTFTEFGKFFKGEKVDPVQVQYFTITVLVVTLLVKMFFPREYFSAHQGAAVFFGILLTIEIFLAGFMGLFVARGHLALSDILKLRRKANMIEKPEESSAVEPELEETTAEQADSTDSAVDTVTLPTEEDPGEEEDDEYYEKPKEKPVFFDENLKARFETLMIDEQLFLTQGITLSEVATKLHSNKTYISKLVNSNYNSTFPDYLNTLRIDYAEQYLLHHRDARQADIAKACGFPSASAFNNTFKKLTGQTPKIWLATKK